MSEDDFASALDGLALIFVGAYVLLVWQNSNVPRLIDELKKESGFIEFVISAAILKWAVEHDQSNIAAPLVGLGVLGIGLSVMNKTNIITALARFARGDAGLFSTVGTIFGNRTPQH